MTQLPTGMLAHIIGCPDDDAARLVAADWLEEHGELNRSEFVRWQVNGGSPGATLYEQAILCWSEEGKPLATPGFWAWLGCLGKHINKRQRRVFEAMAPPQSSTMRYCYRRGFVDEITCTWADFQVLADGTCWHPSQGRPCSETAQPIRKVRLMTMPTWRQYDNTQDRCTEIWLDGLPNPKAGRIGEPELCRSFSDLTPADFVRRALGANWPGIDFELPLIIDARWHTSTRSIQEDLELMRDHVLRQQGIPPEMVRPRNYPSERP